MKGNVLAIARMAPTIRAQVEYDMAHEDGLGCAWPSCHHRAVTLTLDGQYRCAPHRLFGEDYESIRQQVLPVQGLVELTKVVTEKLTANGGRSVLSEVIGALMKRPR